MSLEYRYCIVAVLPTETDLTVPEVPDTTKNSPTENETMPRSQSPQGQIPDDKLSRNKAGIITCIFLFFNVLLANISLVAVGFLIWQIAVQPDVFISGQALVSSCLLSLFLIIFLVSLLGCGAGIVESLKLFKIYILLVIGIAVVHLVVIITPAVQLTTPELFIDQAWSETNTDIKSFVQTQLSCCGLNNYSDYGERPVDLIDWPSCFLLQDGKYKIFRDGCRNNLLEFFQTGLGVGFAVGVLFLIIATQVVTYALSVVVLYRIHKYVKERENIEQIRENFKSELAANKSKNKITPRQENRRTIDEVNETNKRMRLTSVYDPALFPSRNNTQARDRWKHAAQGLQNDDRPRHKLYNHAMMSIRSKRKTLFTKGSSSTGASDTNF